MKVLFPIVPEVLFRKNSQAVMHQDTSSYPQSPVSPHHAHLDLVSLARSFDISEMAVSGGTGDGLTTSPPSAPPSEKSDFKKSKSF